MGALSALGAGGSGYDAVPLRLDWLPRVYRAYLAALQRELVRLLQGHLSDRTNRRHNGCDRRLLEEWPP